MPASILRRLPLTFAVVLALAAAPVVADSGRDRVLIRLVPDAAHAKARPERGVPSSLAARRAAALTAQAGLVAWLRAEGIPHRAFWLVNAVAAQPTPAQRARLAARADVAAVIDDPVRRMVAPKPEARSGQAKIVQPSLTAIGVPTVWAQGITGQGVVIAGQDTGYQWNHPALREAYRGHVALNNATHDYHWHDAIHELLLAGTNVCGTDSPAPCDDDRHGTHTMGTLVGDDGAGEQIGVAPGAEWIGCRNMDRGFGAPSTYIECFEWFVAPTTRAGADPDPKMAPHVINNSWVCTGGEGCGAPQAALMREVVEAVRDAGILVVASAGNAGPGCGTVRDPPAIHAATFTVAATDNGGAIAAFSSRGPAADGTAKPDLAAPGVAIRSSVPGGGYQSLSGTSMAGPHVAGVAALVMSAAPRLRGRPALVERVLRETAVPRASTQTCGGVPGSAVPNAVYGHGGVDAAAAVALARDWVFLDGFD